MTVRLIAAAFVLIVAVSGVLLYRDATAAQRHLRAAEDSLRTAEQQVGDEQFDLAGARLQHAADHADAARQRLDGPLWAMVSALPRIGDVPALGRAAADLVRGTAAIGDEGLSLASEVLEPGALSGLLQGGTVDIAALRQLSEQAQSIDLTTLEQAQADLAATDAARLPASVHDDRELALARAEQLLSTLRNAQGGLDAAIEFTGGDGPRTYLIAAQNPAELRGTGGLIGFMTELQLDDGRISFQEGVDFDPEAELAQRTKLESTRELPPPVERPDWFADRYDHVAGGQYFGSVNIDPHLPTVGQVLLNLYEQETGRRLDGVLMVDPLALGRIVEATGKPIELPAEVASALPPEIPTTIPGEQIAPLVMVDGYDILDGGGPEKKALDRAIIGASLDALIEGGWDARRMVTTFRDLFAERHLQLHSSSAETQAALEAAGVAGAQPHGEDHDVLALTAVNAAPNKADVHVEHTISGELRVQRSAGGGLQREADVRVTVTNPLSPGDHHQYITGSYTTPVPFGSGQQEYEQDGSVRTWLSLWAPESAQLRSVRDAASGLALRTDQFRGLRVFDAFLDTPTRSETAIEVQYTGPVPAEPLDGSRTYELVLWRQAKGIPDRYDLRITAPAGHDAVDVELTGGEANQGLSDVTVEPLTASIEDGDVMLRGHASRDAHLRITFASPGG